MQHSLSSRQLLRPPLLHIPQLLLPRSPRTFLQPRIDACYKSVVAWQLQLKLFVININAVAAVDVNCHYLPLPANIVSLSAPHSSLLPLPRGISARVAAPYHLRMSLLLLLFVLADPF